MDYLYLVLMEVEIINRILLLCAHFTALMTVPTYLGLNEHPCKWKIIGIYMYDYMGSKDFDSREIYLIAKIGSQIKSICKQKYSVSKLNN